MADPIQTAPTDALIERLTTENERMKQQLAAVDMLVGDGFAESVHASLDRAGAPRKSPDGTITYGIIQRIESLLARIEAAEKLGEAAQQVLDRKCSTYRARNGREVGIQGEDGEKCWIVHSDDITVLEAAAAQWQAGQEGEG